MEQFIWILTRPDNLPIVAMVGGLAYLLRVWWRQARRHDALTRQGRADEIGEEMRK